LVAVLLVDLDHFKDINDSFGHVTGDALLVAVARRLRERLRTTDQVARLGGDEFGILLEQEQSPESIATVAQSIMTLVRAPFLLDNGVHLHTDLSIGIALAPDHGQTPQELLQRADTALYKAKQQGRAAFAFYSDELTERAVERIQLSNRLRRAVERSELRVLYQPQVDLVSGRITGAEALMRWENPDIGTISPAHFIPLAEELGCIVGMGEWILREVCRQGKAWLDSGLSAMSLAVNISSVQFSQASFTQQVAAILAETGYPPELLELELTESGFMQLGEQSVTLLQTLRGLGVRLALDDFGTGYSSLAYLKHFPLHVVKIDKSFIDEIHLGVKDKQLVKAIIFMSKSMNFKVLAEGVELPQQLETLKSLKCDLYQGYLKSRPLSPDAFAELVKNEKTRIQS
jgi:diguanylate cyclase (GGDEF)-like protein